MAQEPLLPANSEYRKPRLTDAQKALMDAFIRLNYTMPRHRIKVKDICREAPAARSTFYVYYDNVEMLLDDMENAELYEIIRRTDFVVKMPLQEDMMDSCRETPAYIQEKKEMVLCVFSTRAQYILYPKMEKCHQTAPAGKNRTGESAP